VEPLQICLFSIALYQLVVFYETDLRLAVTEKSGKMESKKKCVQNSDVFKI